MTITISDILKINNSIKKLEEFSAILIYKHMECEPSCHLNDRKH